MFPEKSILAFLLCFLILILGTSSIFAQKNQPWANSNVLSPVTKDTYDSTATAYKTNRSTELRNRLIFMAISQIDLNFGYFQKNKRHRNDLFQTVLDILEVGAATAISITNGERAKSVIADALGFLQGSRAKVNKNLRLTERQILINKMIENRSKILTDIYVKVNETDAQYPFERAFIDILAYYQAGTTDGALSSLATDTGSAATTAQQALNTAKLNAGIVLAPTAQQIKISRENSDFVQGFIDAYENEQEKINTAKTNITAQEAAIAAEEAKKPADRIQSVIDNAKTAKAQQTANKTAAEAKQKATLDKLKAIFASIEQDLVLAPLLDKIPARFPEMQPRLDRIRKKTGTYEDYGSALLRFFRLVTDEAPKNPVVVDRAKNIVDSVK